MGEIRGLNARCGKVSVVKMPLLSVSRKISSKAKTNLKPSYFYGFNSFWYYPHTMKFAILAVTYQALYLSGRLSKSLKYTVQAGRLEVINKRSHIESESIFQQEK
jgi:hypothetical protein